MENTSRSRVARPDPADGAAAHPLPDLAALAAHPDVRDLVERARAAASDLRWHPVLRRRWQEARLEASAWSARSMAQLYGVDAPIEDVRAAFAGEVQWADDEAGAIVAAAVRVCSAARRFVPDLGEPARTRVPVLSVFARLHAAIGVEPVLGLDRAEVVGRPISTDASERLSRLATFVADASPRTPALVLAAVSLAELSAGPFAGGNTLVAEAFHWVASVAYGADPTGVAVPARFRADHRERTQDLLARYRAGDTHSAAAWVCWCVEGFIDGVGWGRAIADSVQRGTTVTSGKP